MSLYACVQCIAAVITAAVNVFDAATYERQSKLYFYFTVIIIGSYRNAVRADTRRLSIVLRCRVLLTFVYACELSSRELRRYAFIRCYTTIQHRLEISYCDRLERNNHASAGIIRIYILFARIKWVGVFYNL